MKERRRSARRLLGELAEVHLGPETMIARVMDISEHGIGLMLPEEAKPEVGAIVWILIQTIASYAITGTIRRVGSKNRIGVEFDEILAGDSREVIAALPLVDDPSEG
jgi:hypothetical protein